MKQNVFLDSLLLLLCLILLSCSQKDESITTFGDRTYSGKYRIEDGSDLEYGLVTITFHETHYEQHGFVEYPASGEFQSEGSFSLQGNTIIFNPTCAEWSKANPIWFLCGEFTYQHEIDSTTFKQFRDNSYAYTITIYGED